MVQWRNAVCLHPAASPSVEKTPPTDFLFRRAWLGDALGVWKAHSTHSDFSRYWVGGRTEFGATRFFPGHAEERPFLISIENRTAWLLFGTHPKLTSTASPCSAKSFICAKRSVNRLSSFAESDPADHGIRPGHAAITGVDD